jgi:hypothetical protein
VGAEGQLPVIDLAFEGDAQPWERKQVAAPTLGTTSLDLEEFVTDSVLRRARRPAKLSLGMGGMVVASVDTSPVFDALDDRAWEALGAGRATCAKPDSLDDCDQLEAYQKSYPASRHAGAARALIDGAAPAFVVMRDDLAYSKADPKGCEKGQTEDACDSLRGYLGAWPAGRHATEAKAALKVGEPKVAKLVARREAAEKAAAKAAEARELAAKRTAEAYRKGIQGNCPMGMLSIPAGTYQIGSDTGQREARPAHSVKVNAFCMGKTEVSVKS